MNGKLGNLLRIGVFYDGHYFYNVSNFYNYQHSRHARISIAGLHEFIKKEVSTLTGYDIRLCQIVDVHYFRGRFSAKKSDELNKLFYERQFDDILMRENVVTHYLPLKYDRVTGKPQEKGVDVWLALEAYELAIYKRFDVLVLIACDGDYVPLVRKVNTLGSQVMLLSWDLEYLDFSGDKRVTRTYQSLLEGVSYPVAMHERIDSRTSSSDLVINNLFVPSQESYAQNANLAIDKEKTKPSLEVYKNSIILNLQNGFGFIKDTDANNVFFHYTSLENIDFNDLRPNMKVKYLQEQQGINMLR